VTDGRNKRDAELVKLLARPYSRILIPDDGGGFSAEVLEFPGCFSEGGSADEAYANLERAAESWLLACLETGKAIPEPLTNYEVSGKFALRLPKSLYTRASKAAARDGVSLNQFITSAVAERLGARSAAFRLEAEVRRGIRKALTLTVRTPTYQAAATPSEVRGRRMTGPFERLASTENVVASLVH
jgi:predicted RNase H-like HicB family nuclease